MTKSITISAGAGSTKISFEDFKTFIHDDNTIDELHGESIVYGPWSIVTSYTALAVTSTFTDSVCGPRIDTYTLHGYRTMSQPKQSGYCLEGRVSIAGVKRSCFTGSILFELPNGT